MIITMYTTIIEIRSDQKGIRNLGSIHQWQLKSVSGQRGRGNLGSLFVAKVPRLSLIDSRADDVAKVPRLMLRSQTQIQTQISDLGSGVL